MLHLGYGATFTVPQVNYDAYGRVTGHTNRTVKIPAASSGSDNCAKFACWWGLWTGTPVYNGDGTFSQGSSDGDGDYYIKWTAPSGGTWQWFELNSYGYVNKTGRISGGSVIDKVAGRFVIRVA